MSRSGRYHYHSVVVVVVVVATDVGASIHVEFLPEFIACARARAANCTHRIHTRDARRESEFVHRQSIPRALLLGLRPDLSLSLFLCVYSYFV